MSGRGPRHLAASARTGRSRAGTSGSRHQRHVGSRRSCLHAQLHCGSGRGCRPAEACRRHSARKQVLLDLNSAFNGQRRSAGCIVRGGQQGQADQRHAAQALSHLVQYRGECRLDAAAPRVEAELAWNIDLHGAILALCNEHRRALEPRLQPLPLGSQRRRHGGSLIGERRRCRRCGRRRRCGRHHAGAPADGERDDEQERAGLHGPECVATMRSFDGDAWPGIAPRLGSPLASSLAWRRKTPGRSGDRFQMKSTVSRPGFGLRRPARGQMREA